MYTLGLCLVVWMQSSHGIPAQETNRADWTIEDIRLGLEALTTSWQTREIHFVNFPENVVEGPLDHPDRLEGVLKQSWSGQILLDGIKYQNGLPFKRVWVGYDGQVVTNVQFKEDALATDTSAAAIQYVELAPFNENFQINFLPEVDLGLYDHSYVYWLNLPGAKVIGVVLVGGEPCVRVEVVLPIGSSRSESEERLILDIDPAMDFWPRQISSTFLGSVNRGTGPIEYSDFRSVDGHWFPYKIVRSFASSVTIKVLTKVVFGSPVDAAEFRPKIPDGVRIRDGLRGKSFISGAEGVGAHLRREVAKHDLEQQRSDVDAERIDANRVPFFQNWMIAALVVLGLGSLVFAVVLWRRA